MVKVACCIRVVHFLYCMWTYCEKGLMRTLVLFLLWMGLFNERRVMQLFAIIEFLWWSHHFPLLTYIYVMLLFILFIEFDFYHFRNSLAKLLRRWSMLLLLFTRGRLWSKCQSIVGKESRIVNLLKTGRYKFVVCL
jgi:hypothetical protein